jgi:hypothetical protein
LSEFQVRLVAGHAEQLLLETLTAPSRERALLKIRGRQRTDSTHILAVIRALKRLERSGENLPHNIAARRELAATIEADRRQLLKALDTPADLPWLREIPAIYTLCQGWTEQYIR